MISFAMLFFLMSPISNCYAEETQTTDDQPAKEESVSTQVASNNLLDGASAYDDINSTSETQGQDASPMDNPSESAQITDGSLGDEEAYYGNAYDPLESLNRATHFANDKFVFKPILFPISDSWEENAPEKVREGIKNIAHCASMPVRVVGDLMQFKAEKAIVDFWSIFNLVTLCTVDIYTPDDNLDNEGVSQGLAYMGIPEGPAITWPVLGPSNLRNSIGTVGDIFLNPQTYLGFPANFIIAAVEAINDPEQKNAYRDFESSSVDQYAAVRDGFRTNFNKKVKK